MKAPLEKLKNMLHWGPGVARQLERVAAIDERLEGIAAAQKKEVSFLPEGEHLAAIIDWIRRQRMFRSTALGNASDMLRLLGHPTPHDPQIVNVSDLTSLLFLFFGEAMEREAGRVLAEISAENPQPRGRPAAERAGILAQLSEERAQLVVERAALVDAIGAASDGVLVVAQLEETAQERRVAARVAEQAAENAAIQEAHKQGVPVGVPAHLRGIYSK